MRKLNIVFLASLILLTEMFAANVLFAQPQTRAIGALEANVRRKLDYLLAMPLVEVKKSNEQISQARATQEIAAMRQQLGRKLSNFAGTIAIQNIDVEEPTVDVLIKANKNAALQNHPKLKNTTIHTGENFDYFTANVKIADLQEIALIEDVIFIEASKMMTPVLGTSTDLINAKEVWEISELANANKKITGKDVYIGILDGLVQWEHETFVNDNGQYRVQKLWRNEDGNEIIYEQPFIPSFPPEVTDDHGTHVAGIAAGDGSLVNSDKKGVAYESNILAAEVKTTGHVVNAFQWMINEAMAAFPQIPLSANLSQAVRLGPHDGTTVFEETLNSMISANAMFIVASGNESRTSSPFPHFQDQVPDIIGESLEFEFTINNTSTNEILVELWFDGEFDVQVGDNDPFFTDWSNIVLFDTDSPDTLENYGNADDKIIIWNYGSNTNPSQPNSTIPNLSNSKVISIFYDGGNDNHVDPGDYKIRLFPNSTGKGGVVDGYHDSEASLNGGFKAGDNFQSITIPGYAAKVITVGAHAKSVDGDIWEHSSLGPSRIDDENTVSKPDIAAPGVDIVSSIDVSVTSYGSMQGTSMAAPHLTGAAALLLQNFPNLTAEDVKLIFQNSAGAIPGGPLTLEDRKYWGAGKLDVLAAYEYMVGFIYNATFIYKDKFVEAYNDPISAHLQGLPIEPVDQNWSGFFKQEMTNGAIVYRESDANAHWLGEGIFNKWIEPDVFSMIGAPLTNEYLDPNNNNYATVDFGNGQIYWDGNQATVILYSSLLADFTASSFLGIAPLTVQFTDLSTADNTTITSWQWDFHNDGTVDSFEPNPVFVYSEAGIYSVRLEVSDGVISNSKVKDNYINVQTSEPLPIIARIEYFFDTDPGFGNGIELPISPSDNIDVQATIDLTGLSIGLHRLYIRAQDENGTWGIPQAKSVLVQSTGVNDPLPNIVSAEYFFDQDPEVGNGTSFNFSPGSSIDITENLDLANLSLGLHRLYVRAQDENGQWGIPQAKPVLVQSTGMNDPLPNIVSAEYFFDQDPEVGNGTSFSFPPGSSIDIAENIDLANLPLGLHRLYIRAQDETGAWGIPQAVPVLVQSTVTNDPLPNIVEIEYFFDEEPGFGNGNAIQFSASPEVEVNTNFPLDALTLGNHVAYVRAKDADGFWGIPQFHEFEVQMEGNAGSISGIVTDVSTGQPIQGASVSASGGYSDPDGTDANGFYQILNVPAESGYTVTASASGYQSAQIVNISVTASQTTTVDFALQPDLSPTSPWPMFQHDASHTGFSTSIGPNVGNILWAFETGGAITSSPVIAADGTVYFGSTDQNIYAIHADGNEKWRFLTSGQVTSTAAIATEGTVYFGTQEGLYAFEEGGTQVWFLPTANAIESALVIDFEGFIYFQSGGRLYKIDQNGNLVWRKDQESDPEISGAVYYKSPTIAPNGNIYSPAGRRSGTLWSEEGDYVFHSDGNLAWRVLHDVDMIQTIDATGRLFSGGRSFTGVIWIGNFRVVAEDGSGIRETQEIMSDASAAITPTNALYYVRYNSLNVIDVQSWTPIWPNPQELASATNPSITSSPVVDVDGNVFIGSSDGNVYAFSASGDMMWEKSIGTSIASSPALGSDGTLYIGSSDGRLYAFGFPSPGPLANIASPKDSSVVLLGYEVAFDASGTGHPTENPNELQYDWDFGDGNTASGITINHAFSDAGDHQINLTVTDSDQRTHTTSITVSAISLPTPGSKIVDEDFDVEIDEGLFSLNGTATVDINSGQLVLTTQSQSAAGSFFYVNRIEGTSFTASFDFKIGPGTGADGMTFAFINEPNPSVLGGAGGGLGFLGLQGYAVEFDTWQNDWAPLSFDINDNHIGISETQEGTMFSLFQTDQIPELEGEEPKHVDVLFDHGQVSVFLEGLQIIDYELPNYQVYHGFLGFTAATGGSANRHAVDNFVAYGSLDTKPSLTGLNVAPFPAELNQAITFSGKILLGGTPAELEFGVEDPVSLQSRLVQSNADGTFGFTTAPVSNTDTYIFHFIKDGEFFDVVVVPSAPTAENFTFMLPEQNLALQPGQIGGPLNAQSTTMLIGDKLKGESITVQTLKDIARPIASYGRHFIQEFDGTDGLYWGATGITCAGGLVFQPLLAPCAGLVKIGATGLLVDAGKAGLKSFIDYLVQEPGLRQGYYDAIDYLGAAYVLTGVDVTDGLEVSIDIYDAGGNLWQALQGNPQEASIRDIENDGNGNITSFTIEAVSADGQCVYEWSVSRPNSKAYLMCYADSPVDLLLTSPDGLQIGKEISEVPNATYLEANIDGDPDIEDVIKVHSPIAGDWSITVIPHSDALPTDTYSLRAAMHGDTTVLADNVLIQNIPAEPYMVGVDPQLRRYSYPFPQAGWYMASMPAEVVDPQVVALFPEAAAAYGWSNNSYHSIEVLQTQTGFWLLMLSPKTEYLSGTPVASYTANYPQGWHLIGGATDWVDFTDPNDSPDGSIIATFGWDAASQSYFPATTLKPGKGYWIAVAQECDLTIGGNTSSTIMAKTNKTMSWQAFAAQYGELPPPPPNLTAIENQPQIPMGFSLSQNYPNPFNPETKIEYALAEKAYVQLEIYDVLGQKINILVMQEKPAGYHTVIWDGMDENGNIVPGGVYFVRMRAGGFSTVRKLMFLK